MVEDRAAHTTSGASPSCSFPTPIQRGARSLLRAVGWRVAVRFPPVPRCVILVYPHTSNWDFVVGYLAKLAAGLPTHWMGKDSLFRWPFGRALRWMGGIPVNRSRPAGLLDDVTRQLAERRRMFVAIAPEGTRSRADHWKSGFYRLALAAKVPVGLAYIDWKERVVGLDEFLTLTGDEAADLARIRAAYGGKLGKFPDQASEIRFRDERG